MIYAYLILVACISVCAYAIGYMMGYAHRKRDDNMDALNNAESLRKTYVNGVRIGKRQMLDELVHAGKLDEKTARTVSDAL